MNKILLAFFILCAILPACKKSTESGSAAYYAQAAIDDQIITNYLKANPSLAAKRIDTTGVYYIIKQQGSGSALFTNSTSVTVADTGRILTTQQIFSSTNGFTPSYVLSTVITGWQIGIPKCPTGGIIRLLIPSRYAYGPYPQPQYGLPANAILDFDIALLDVTN